MIASIVAMLTFVRQGLQSLAGSTGKVTTRAVTFDDLVAMGFITVQNNLATVASASNTGDTGLDLSSGTTTLDNVTALSIGPGTLSGTSSAATFTITESSGGTTIYNPTVGFTLSDGTHTLSSVSTLDVTGATISGSGSTGTLAISGGGGGVTYPPSTMDPDDYASGTGTLSNGNLTMTAGGGYGWARSTSPRSSGKLYFEVTEVSFGAYQDNNIGIATWQATNGSDDIPAYVACYAQYGNLCGANGQNNSSQGLGSGTAGDVRCVAVDFENNNMWVRRNGGNWCNSATDNPETNTGGIFNPSQPAHSQLPLFFKSTPIYAFLCVYTGTITVNFGATAFAHALPSGFEAWG